MQNGSQTNGAHGSAPIQSTNDPLFGVWKPNIQLKYLFYGEHCVVNHLRDVLPSPSSKVFIVTGQSLATRTPLLQDLENLLKDNHAGTCSSIRQHGPAVDVDAALEKVLEDDGIDVVLSLGGGSPIDSAKTIAYRVSEQRGRWLYHITVPTTLSAAECTPGGGYTKAEGTKAGFMAPEMGVKAIFYDPHYASYTPRELWLSTGMRAMDHAVECFYHPYASEIWKAQGLYAAHSLFENLPKAKDNFPKDTDTITRLQLAAFLSSGLKGSNLKGGMGLSHSLGHALGSPYGIPHGITSCLTLGRVVKMKAAASKEDAAQIARLLPAAGGVPGGDMKINGCEVGDRILKLVEDLGIAPGTLSDLGVKREEHHIIASRACGGATEGPLYESVYRLVESLF